MARRGAPARSLTSSRSRPTPLGKGRGRNGGASGRSYSGVSDMMIWARSTPDAPSIMQWCILLIVAKRPSVRPSMIQSSHRGRARSRGCDMIRADIRLS